MESLNDIFDDCGLSVLRYEQLHGGDINQSYCLFTSPEKLFLKLNDEKKFPLMFEKEANGLTILSKYCGLKIPQVIKTGICDSSQYLLLEWLEKGSLQKNTWEQFGSKIATMHKQPQPYYGLNEDNYIGSLNQTNTSNNQWDTFFIECRIMPLIKTLFDEEAYSAKDLETATSFCNKLASVFPPEPPSLLHGDLW